MQELILFSVSIFAGFLGALLGIGGGMIVVPVLTLYFGVDIRYAIAASLISVVATSSGAAVSYLRDHLTNLRVGVLLEVGTVLGAITGFLIVSFIRPQIIFIVFGSFLILSIALMLRRRTDSLASQDHPWSQALSLSGSYLNERGQRVSYFVDRVPIALFVMYFAGALSALLGIGSGVLKVLAMDSAMKLPIKVSSATSNFMIGVTATASAGAYFLQGMIRPEIAGPVAIGILIGSFLGAKVMVRIQPEKLRYLFIALLAVVAVQMFLRGFST